MIVDIETAPAVLHTPRGPDQRGVSLIEKSLAHPPALHHPPESPEPLRRMRRALGLHKLGDRLPAGQEPLRRRPHVPRPLFAGYARPRCGLVGARKYEHVIRPIIAGALLVGAPLYAVLFFVPAW
jgi:hypothetical protein